MSERLHTLAPLRANPRVDSARVTEIRGPYDRSFGPAYLDDLVGVLAPFVDWLIGGRWA